MIEFKSARARLTRREATPSAFRTMSPRQSREARAIAYKAALAVIG